MRDLMIVFLDPMCYAPAATPFAPFTLVGPLPEKLCYLLEPLYETFNTTAVCLAAGTLI